MRSCRSSWPWVGRLRDMDSKRREGKSNVPLYITTVLGLLIYAVGTYAVVEVAGGTDVSSEHGNTPNAVAPGPPADK